MVRYANPTSCPDCLAALPESPIACPQCHLPLVGQTAADLFATLQSADRLLLKLRAGEAAVPTALPVPPYDAAPFDAPLAPAPPRPGLSAPSVPRILLGLGVLCLLVAAVTFLVVTWSWLGVGGRTTVLLLLTAASGVLSAWLHGRDLRLAGESLAVIAFGLLVLDLVGADDAGWLGSLTGAGLLALVGAVVGGTGLVVSLGLRDAPAPMVAPQVFGALGAWAVAAGLALESDHATFVAAVAAAGLLGLTVGARALAMRLLGVLLGVAATWWWLTLLVAGTARAVVHASLAGLVADGHGWPLLAAAALLAGAALTVRAQPALAGALLGGAGIVGGALLLIPAADNHGADLGLVVVVLLVLGAAATVLVARPWLRAAELPVVAVAVVGLGLFVESGVAAADILGHGLEVTWSRDWSADVAAPSYAEPRALPALMLLPLVTALLLAAVTWRRSAVSAAALAREYAVPLVAGLALTAALVAVLEALPAALVLAVVVAASAGLGAWAVGRDGDGGAGLSGLAGAAALTCLALVVALPSVVLTAVTLTLVVTASGALLVGARGSDRTVMWASAAVLPGALGGLVWSLSEITSVPDVWRAAPVLFLLGLLAVVRPQPALEGSAALVGAVAAAASVDAAAHEPTALALYLTLAGALVTASSLVHDDRRALGWLGGLLLAAATWVRLWDVGVDTPEAYTLPSAVALLLVGLRHLSRHPEAGSARALTPGLVLATVPSLLRVMVEDPVSLRAGLLGLACLGLVLAGAALRWQAPLLVGAAAGAVLVLREWGPYAGIVPPWVWIAAAGTTLLVVGVTWERRLQDLRSGTAYLARLR